MITRSELGPAQRAEALSRLAEEEFDVLVVGGGVVGAGAALDAATRGLSVALVEARDYASGTSSRSSKLIHGGLRYLEQLEFGLVREALRERSLILNGSPAPGPAGPVPLPPAAPGLGAALRRQPASRCTTSSAAGTACPAQAPQPRAARCRLFPALRKDALVGAVRYYDGQVDDARHTMMLARTAAPYGAAVRPAHGSPASSARATASRASSSRIWRAVRRSRCGPGRRSTPPGSGPTTSSSWSAAEGSSAFAPPRASTFVVPRDRINATVGLISRTEKSVLFVIPWGSHWIIGTTDTDWNLDLAHPAASRSDIDYLLDHVNRLLTTPLTHDDIQGVYAGLRPLLTGESDATSQLSREHAVVTPVAGLT